MCFFEPTWPFYLRFNLSKTIHFLKRPWFLYVLSKYQAMYKVLQWNARLWKITSIINLIIPFHSVFVTIQQSERNFSFKRDYFCIFSSLSGHFILNLTFPRPYIFWNVHDSSTFCQIFRACLKSCSEMPGYENTYYKNSSFILTVKQRY